MSFPRYPKYKDSGVEWLGEVPEYWEVSRLGFETWVRARLGWKGLKAEEYVDDGYVLLATPNIKGSEIDFLNVNYINQHRFDESPEIKLRVRDVVLAKDGSTLGTVNVIRSLPRPATVNSSIAVITPGDRIDGIYLCYLFKSSFMENTIQRIKGGMGVPHLFQEDLNKFYIPLPSLAEQAAIASFLDRETAKIDALIAEQQRLIELLDEQIKASALCAFTNPDASEYRLEQVCQIISRPVIEEEGSLYTRLGLYNRGRGIFHKDPADPEDLGESDFFWVKKGDLILSGQFAWEGAIAIAGAGEEGCVVSHRYPILRGIPSLALTEFLFALLSTKHGDFLLNEHSRGSAGRNRPLNIKSLLKEKIPIPKLQAQSPVAEMFYRRSELLGAIAQQTSLLQERRSALISAAVTGQIDVRGLAPKEAA